jgi:hypothetical protein
VVGYTTPTHPPKEDNSVKPAEYAALSRYLNELTGRNPEWAPPIEAIHHVSLHPGYDTVSALWYANVTDARRIVSWSSPTDGSSGFYTEVGEEGDPQRVAQEACEAIAVVCVFSYQTDWTPKKDRVEPVRSPLDDTFKPEEYEFTCDGEFGDPQIFIGCYCRVR